MAGGNVEVVAGEGGRVSFYDRRIGRRYIPLDVDYSSAGLLPFVPQSSTDNVPFECPSAVVQWCIVGFDSLTTSSNLTPFPFHGTGWSRCCEVLMNDLMHFDIELGQ